LHALDLTAGPELLDNAAVDLLDVQVPRHLPVGLPRPSAQHATYAQVGDAAACDPTSLAYCGVGLFVGPNGVNEDCEVVQGHWITDSCSLKSNNVVATEALVIPRSSGRGPAAANARAEAIEELEPATGQEPDRLAPVPSRRQ
jgi:hypothetical protein